MKKNNTKVKSLPPWEKPLFILIMTFVGGYMNGYTYVTRNKVLANMHTANMSNLGINIALGDWDVALKYFIPIIACISGAAFSELINVLITKVKLKGDWRKYALILEATALFLVGLIPAHIDNSLVTNFVSFLMGYQLCLFKDCLGITFNTTICTGNLRNVGNLLFNALSKESKASYKKLITFTVLTFSFAIGTIPGTLISLAINVRAVWICSLILLLECWWMNTFEKYKA